MAERQINASERKLIFDLDNLGMSRQHLGDFFGISQKTVYQSILKEKAKDGNKTYSLEETSQIMTRYLLASLARNMHKLTEEQKLRFLPDLLKVKDGMTAENDLGIKIYTPRKTKIKPDEIEDIIDDQNGMESS